MEIHKSQNSQRSTTGFEMSTPRKPILISHGGVGNGSDRDGVFPERSRSAWQWDVMRCRPGGIRALYGGITQRFAAVYHRIIGVKNSFEAPPRTSKSREHRVSTHLSAIGALITLVDLPSVVPTQRGKAYSGFVSTSGTVSQVPHYTVASTHNTANYY